MLFCSVHFCQQPPSKPISVSSPIKSFNKTSSPMTTFVKEVSKLSLISSLLYESIKYIWLSFNALGKSKAVLNQIIDGIDTHSWLRCIDLEDMLRCRTILLFHHCCLCSHFYHYISMIGKYIAVIDFLTYALKRVLQNILKREECQVTSGLFFKFAKSGFISKNTKNFKFNLIILDLIENI
ncbi:hypothetical protein BpHYR1_051169 [Brachionus plicatilis]|uniref:Uncharacterized protein n=1 Tax=Brachionus plicatilis TaxID=10195 RepID=A0A3M7RGV6_BRAPC|nr:hypothetical protein BpHYR1_051169 [Brachionus plicatilis]